MKPLRTLPFVALALAVAVGVGASSYRAHAHLESVTPAWSWVESSAQAQPVTPAAIPSEGAAGLPSLAPLVESVKGAVVNVDVQSRVAAQGSDDPLQFFGGQNPWGGRRRPSAQIRQGAGSGFIIAPTGRVLTNNHVVEGAEHIRVRLEDGRAFDAHVLGRDPLTDVALLQIDGDVGKLPTVRLGNSDAMRVGDWAVAIGNPFGLASSVSAGIISARARDIHAGPYDDFLQTDAAINPGNSGGPLFNLKGEVIGINTAIVGGGTGIGFAVPSNMAQALLSQLEKGEITRGWLGVSIQDVTPDLARALGAKGAQGALVAEVMPNSPASQGGLREQDIVTAVDGTTIDSSRALTRLVGLRQPGTTVKLTCSRDGAPKIVSVALGRRPDAQGDSAAPPPEDQPEQGHLELGLSFKDVATRSGRPVVVVASVEPGSVAERAGLQPGMRVREAAGRPVRSSAELVAMVRQAAPGSELLLKVESPGGGNHLLRALPIP